MSALRVAVVTGTARPHGIGRACARAFVRAGYRVLGVDKLRLQDEPGAGSARGLPRTGQACST